MRRRSYCGFCGSPLGALIGNQQDCTACGVPTFYDAKPCAAVIVLDGADNVLLGRRAREPMRGLWDLPGGFCDPDEIPEACAVRELAEETGCLIAIDRFLGHLIDTYGHDGDTTLNAIFVAHIIKGEPEPSDDVDALRWFPLSALPPDDELAFRNTREALALLGD
ncbi:MAG: NUDIX hydrolase [Thermoleophilia bacterium]|nr:NUDIX hydrolase [Thermoleophilia bacterium]